MSINGRDIFDLMAYIGFKPILKDNGPATDFYWEEDDSVKISLDNIHHARDLVFKMLDAAKEDGYLMAKEEFEDDLNKAQKIIKFYEDAASKRIIPTVVKRWSYERSSNEYYPVLRSWSICRIIYLLSDKRKCK